MYVLSLRRDACTRSASDANRRNAREHVSDVFAVGDKTEQSVRLSAQTRAFAFCEAAPHAVTLTVRKRVFEAIQAYFAVHAHSLRGITGASTLGEEQIRIFTATQRGLLPVVPDTPHARPPV